MGQAERGGGEDDGTSSVPSRTNSPAPQPNADRPLSAASAVTELHLSETGQLTYPRGAHIKTWSGKAKGLSGGLAFEHHGIYVSDEEVIHFTRQHAFSAAKDGLVVEVTTLSEFGDPSAIIIAPRGWQEAEETVARARESVGSGGYELLGNNCEHFATWCRTGVSESKQVSSVTKHTVAGSLPGAGVGGAIAAALGTTTTTVYTIAPGGCFVSGATVVSAGAVMVGCATGMLIGAAVGGMVWAAVNGGNVKREAGKGTLGDGVLLSPDQLPSSLVS